MSLGIGPVTRNAIKRLLDGGEVDQVKVDQFFDAVRAFFVQAYEYCIQWLPLDNRFLKNVVFVDCQTRAEMGFPHHEEPVSRFKQVHHAVLEDPTMLDAVEEHFLDYQATC